MDNYPKVRTLQNLILRRKENALGLLCIQVKMCKFGEEKGGCSNPIVVSSAPNWPSNIDFLIEP
jgi:hypothetical protein